MRSVLAGIRYILEMPFNEDWAVYDGMLRAYFTAKGIGLRPEFDTDRLNAVKISDFQISEWMEENIIL